MFLISISPNRPRLALYFRAYLLALACLCLPGLAAAQDWSFSHTGSIVTWTVPQSGTYRVVAIGAQGVAGDTSFIGGRGTRIEGEFVFVAGQVLQIAVGGRGIASDPTTDFGNGGGGGGTFLVGADNTPLLKTGGNGESGVGIHFIGTRTSNIAIAYTEDFVLQAALRLLTASGNCLPRTMLGPQGALGAVKLVFLNIEQMVTLQMADFSGYEGGHDV